MDIYNKPDYYPIPTERVITYGGNAGHTRCKTVLKADLVALIVHLSSPMGEVDYSAISDLFLVYRNFLPPMELSDLLIMRFRWCMQEVGASDAERAKIGRIALVRTFVLLRHWILNYFIQDFLSDVDLRMKLINFLNEPCSASMTIVKSTLVNLKKAWVYCMKNTWTNLKLDEPRIIGNNEAWGDYHINDYSQLEDVRRRDSQLSNYAKRGASSPSFRNQSVLSLFNNAEILKLHDNPTQDSKRISSQRTGSMMLFPCDNSNAKTDMIVPLFEQAQSPVNEQKGALTHTEYKNKMSHISKISKITNVSSMMKDIKCPETPGIDKLMPPTPAKKVEIILKLPENLDDGSDSKQNTNRNSNIKSTNTKHRGAVGLLSKWRRNHSILKIDQPKTASQQITKSYSKPEMDSFVKYVISITSLENREHENAELMNSVHSKFDILSARTIEEVEYLVSMENELIKEVHNTIPHNQISCDATESKTEIASHLDSSQIGFSAVDNLNLYQTVNSIANSVVSLSKTLDQHRKNQPPPNGTLSPSFAALERRRVQSSFAAVMHNRSRISLISQYNYKDDTTRYLNEGPQRLVFHDNNGCKKFTDVSLSDPTLSSSPSKRAPLQHPNRTSPLKQILPNVYEINTKSEEQRNSFISSISYDSQLSNISKKEFKAQSSLVDCTDENDFPIKRKLAQANLREFTFEDKKAEENQVKNQSVVSNSSFVTTREFENVDNISTPKLKTPNKALASGRISLIQKKNSHLSRQIIAPKSPVEVVRKDADFIEKDKQLLKNEIDILELEREPAARLSAAASVNTDILFSSKQSSPRKCTEQIKQIHIELSKRPSIKSIDGEALESKNVTDKIFSKKESLETVQYDNQANRFTSPLNEEISGDSSFNFLNGNDNDANGDDLVSTGLNNKYLFSPDNESTDIASPAKNVEELKDKFLKKEDTEANAEAAKVSIYDEENRENGARTSGEKENDRLKVLNHENVVDIANLPDDSVHDDPVNVALMKLEGTYEKSTEENAEKPRISPTASALAEEVDMLGISQLAVPPTSPADKRRSLIIERRRQTMMEIPFTPANNTPETNGNKLVGSKKIAELLNGYEIRDPRLLVANSEEHVPFILMYDSLSVAQQMTLIEKELLGEIDWNELLNLKLAYSAPHVTSWLQLLVQNETLSGIDLAIARFNLTVDWIISEIVMTSDVKLKRNTIQRFIHVAEHCRSFQNYNTLMEIILALSSSVVQKLSEAWRLIEPGDLVTWEGLKHIPSLDRNYSAIRNLLNHVNPIKGCIPFIAVYLSDLSLNSEKRSWFVEKQVVNYNKFDTNVQIVKNFIQKVQWSKFYDFTADNELLSKCVYLSSLSSDEITFLTNNRKLDNC